MAGMSTGGDAGRDDDALGDAGRGRGGAPDRLPDGEVDARWTELVAQLGDIDVPAADDPVADPPAPPTRIVSRSPGPRDWPTTPEVEALEEAESHFVPPDPGPIVTGRDPLVTLAWAGVVGIPVLAIVALIVRAVVPAVRAPAWIGLVAVVAFIAAVAVLVWRMPQHRDPDDHDNGAVV